MYKVLASVFTALALIPNALAAPTSDVKGSLISDTVDLSCDNSGYEVDVFERAAFGTAGRPYNHADLDTVYKKSFSINRKGSNLFLWATPNDVPATRDLNKPHMGHIYNDNRYQQVDLRSVVVRHRGYFLAPVDSYYTLTSRASDDESEIAFGTTDCPQRVSKTQKLDGAAVSVTIRATKGQYVYFSYTTANSGSGPMKWQGDITYGDGTGPERNYLDASLFVNKLCKSYLEWPNTFETLVRPYGQ